VIATLLYDRQFGAPLKSCQRFGQFAQIGVQLLYPGQGAQLAEHIATTQGNVILAAAHLHATHKIALPFIGNRQIHQRSAPAQQITNAPIEVGGAFAIAQALLPAGGKCPVSKILS
jgi:hypothetical protein